MQTTAQKLKAKMGAGSAADAVAAAAEQVNAAAERVRWQYVPPGMQSSVYQNKAAEADKCRAVIDAAGTPVATDYPYLNAEIGINGANVGDVAAAVIAKRDLWLGIVDPTIEGTRQALQKDLEDLDSAAPATLTTARQLAADAQRTIEAAVAAALGG